MFMATAALLSVYALSAKELGITKQEECQKFRILIYG